MSVVTKYGVPIAFCTNCVVTYALGTGLLNDAFKSVIGHIGNNREISNNHPTLVTPTGRAFIIWAPIFLLETASVVWQSTAAEGQALIPISNAAPYFIGGCLSQAAFGFAFSTGRIYVSSGLISAITFGIANTHHQMVPLSSTNYFLGVFPFALHTQWVTCAALIGVNTSAMKLGCGLDVEFALAQATQIAAAVFGIYMSAKYGDSTFAAVSGWGLHFISCKLVEEDSAVVKKYPEDVRLKLSGRAAFLSKILVCYSIMNSSTIITALSQL